MGQSQTFPFSFPLLSRDIMIQKTWLSANLKLLHKTTSKLANTFLSQHFKLKIYSYQGLRNLSHTLPS